MDLHASKRLLGDGDCFAFGRRASHLIPFLLGFGLVLLLGGFFPEALFELFLDIVDEIVEHLVLHLFLQVLLLFPVFQLGLPVLVTIGEVVGGRGEDVVVRGVVVVWVVGVGGVVEVGMPFHPVVAVVALEVDPVEGSHPVHFVIFIYFLTSYHFS